jgi:hypothetical protein
MTQPFFHDPLPVGVVLTPALHERFTDWFDGYQAMCQEGYWCRPVTHILVAWLAGREDGVSEATAVAMPAASAAAESEAALQMLRDAGLEMPHAPHHPRTGA